MALGSPETLLFVNCRTIASFLVSLRLRPFSVTVMRSRPTFSKIVARFLEPLAGLLDSLICPS
jgi:hypothetical protein